MFYRENGQFKTTYQADQQIFPIAQDRWAVLFIVAFAFVGVPMLASEYLFLSILIPFRPISVGRASWSSTTICAARSTRSSSPSRRIG